jgi:hypothetical protein
MNTNKKWAFIFLIASIVIAILSTMPRVQKMIQPFLAQSSRSILAKITAYYGVDQNQYLILKVKDSAGIQIEIYQINPKTSVQEFRQKFDLLQDSDAYVTIEKNSTNLALSDVDKDGQLDILAPSVDQNGNLRLNTFRFNVEMNNFESYTEANK